MSRVMNGKNLTLGLVWNLAAHICLQSGYKMIQMNNKISLVTGANGGMGKVIATELARQGATVMRVSRDRRKGED
jgi:hypothetical protein